MNYYREIKVIDPDFQFVIGKIFKVIHAFTSQINKNNEQLGITFPFWDNSSDKVNTGDVIRLFSSKNTLEDLENFEGIMNLVKFKVIKLYLIKETPQVSQYIRFSRDRSIEKKTEKYQFKKKENLKEKFKEDFKETTINKNKKNDLKNIYYLKLESKSTEQKAFSLFIKGQEVSKLSNSFSTYGLCNDSDRETGLPYF